MSSSRGGHFNIDDFHFSTLPHKYYTLRCPVEPALRRAETVVCAGAVEGLAQSSAELPDQRIAALADGEKLWPALFVTVPVAVANAMERVI